MSSVDVIVPCYRYGHFLRECVGSVLSQTGPHIRVLIIDDASPDNSATVAEELARFDSRVLFVRHSKNKGHIATYNEGIEWVSADYLLLLSADDYLLPGALDRAVTFLDAHPNVGFVFGSALEISETGPTTEVIPVTYVLKTSEDVILSGPEFLEVSHCRNIVPTPTVVVRTTIQQRAGGYRQELPHTGDMEMWWRLAAYASVGILSSIQAVYRRHAANMSHTYIGHNRLLDLQQRKAALDCFMDTCGSLLHDATKTRRRMARSLGYDAISCASTAFNDGQIGLCDQLSKFALEVSQECKHSLPWIKLACKCQLGLERWRTVQPFITLMRQLAMTVKRPVQIFQDRPRQSSINEQKAPY